MLIFETKHFQLGKIREFIYAMDHLDEEDEAKILVNEIDGKITIQLSVNNDHSCLSVYNLN